MRQGNIKISDSGALWRPGDRMWGGIGLGVAGLSACFAAYMLAFGPGEGGLRSLDDFGVFARMRRSERVADGRVLPLLQGAARPASGEGNDIPSAVTASASVDFTPTGTVVKADGTDARSPAAAGSSLQSSDRPLPAFILRDVFDGSALVETPSTITLVSKGSVIAGAGEVLSIERRGNQWAVITSGGVIGGAR